MALYRNGAFVTDRWCFPEAGAPLPARGALAVDGARYRTERDSLLARGGDIGVVLSAGDSLAELRRDLDRLALIVLRLPRFADGRPYSMARTLRDALGFGGELRATGDVLRDQIVFLLRAGFDALEVTDAGTIAALREGRVVGVRRHYQPAALPGEALAPSGPSWRRISSPSTAAG